MLCVSFGWGIFLIETGFQYSSMNAETLKYVQGEGNGEMPQTPPDSTCFQCERPPPPPALKSEVLLNQLIGFCQAAQVSSIMY